MSADFIKKLFTTSAEFVAGAATIEQIPSLGNLPEFAFVGRSNVGKSSMINALVGRNGLVRVSVKPGCTRQLNFFKISEKFVLVDLPGYGFAKLPKSQMENWNSLIIKYLKGRRELKRIYMLVDPKVGLKESDLQVAKILDDSGISYRIVLTKIDKCSKEELAKTENFIKGQMDKHAAMYPELIATSIKLINTISEFRHEIITNIKL
ncbi:MAG: YihA family ribosome biogenesis GTP-binding protein [Sphingobacteriia bacterium]|nr:YihA family ribosome biogenesis GTP-binding protein [Sphingobacteriia bacterium]